MDAAKHKPAAKAARTTLTEEEQREIRRVRASENRQRCKELGLCKDCLTDGVVMSLDGDSGAPWFNGYTAHGIHHGGFDSGDGLYMAINYIDILGLTVITD